MLSSHSWSVHGYIPSFVLSGYSLSCHLSFLYKQSFSFFCVVWSLLLFHWPSFSFPWYSCFSFISRYIRSFIVTSLYITSFTFFLCYLVTLFHFSVYALSMENKQPMQVTWSCFFSTNLSNVLNLGVTVDAMLISLCWLNMPYAICSRVTVHMINIAWN